MGAHLNDKGEFQSDKYPTCPADKVPLSVHDKDAQPFLWAYAELHKSRDHEFAIDLQARLRAVGFEPRVAMREVVSALSKTLPGTGDASCG